MITHDSSYLIWIQLFSNGRLDQLLNLSDINKDNKEYVIV
jgi:hypothetical protein